MPTSIQIFIFYQKNIEDHCQWNHRAQAREIDKFIWEINGWFPIKNQEPQFKIETDADGNLDINVIKKDNPYFNFIINAHVCTHGERS
jgi:hypothetical protein